MAPGSANSTSSGVIVSLLDVGHLKPHAQPAGIVSLFSRRGNRLKGVESAGEEGVIKPRLLGSRAWDLSLAALSESHRWAQVASCGPSHLLWKSSPSGDCLLN